MIAFPLAQPAGLEPFPPEVDAALSMERNALLSAGAGTGKTTALCEAFVRRVLAGISPRCILALTFTEKAASELSQRARAELVRRGFDEAARELESGFVGTYHAFCARLLRERPAAAGVAPDFEVLEEPEARGLLHEAAVEAVLTAVDGPGGEALAALVGLCGVERRAGVAELVASLALAEQRWPGLPDPPARAAGPDPREALAAAMAELSALARARGKAAKWKERCAAAAEAWERVRGGPLGEEALGALGEALKGRFSDERARATAAAAKEALERIALAARERDAAPLRQALRAVAAAAARGYAARKAARGALDFDDLVLKARDLLRRDRQARRAIKERWRAVLVDEYQDTDPAQEEALLWLCEAAGEEVERVSEVRLEPGKLLAVGDKKQSIYLFRGADVEVFARIEERLATEGAVARLMVNRRSVPALVELSNALFREVMPGGARRFEVAFGDGDALHARREGGARPAAELWIDPAPEEGGAAGRREREARALAARVAAFLERGAPGCEGPLRPREVAFLFRRGTRLWPYQRALEEAGVPCRVGRGSLWRSREADDLSALLRLCAGEADGSVMVALLRSPWCGLSDDALTLLAAAPGGLPGALWRPPPTGLAPLDAQRLLRFAALAKSWRRLAGTLGAADLLDRALGDARYAAAVALCPDGARRAANAERIVERLREQPGAATLAGAIATMALWRRESDEPEAAGESEAVELLTIHQAKGLEWPVVVVPDLGARPRADARRAAYDPEVGLAAQLLDAERGEFLETVSSEALEALFRRRADAEGRRLLYVALTRARDYLVLSGEEDGGKWRAWIEDLARRRPDLVVTRRYGEAPGSKPGPKTAPKTETRPGPEPESERAQGRPSDPPPGSSSGAQPPTAAQFGPVCLPPKSVPGVLDADRAIAARLVARATRPPQAPPPAPRVAATELAEYARCPRRHHFAFVLGVEEHPLRAGKGRDGAAARGQLAHAMLEILDFAAPPLEQQWTLAAVARRLGFDPQGTEAREVARDVLAFAHSPEGRALGARGTRLEREVPFLARLESEDGACYVAGTLDLLARGREGTRILDYKHARGGHAKQYAGQLALYALALWRAEPEAPPPRCALVWLRGRGPAAVQDVTPAPEELAALAARAPAMARAIAAGAPPPLPEALGRDLARCRAERCGYTGLCYATACGRPQVGAAGSGR